ncbi:hypothetical protein ACFL1N_15270 [Thermodesulfobacteriota bacterium]
MPSALSGSGAPKGGFRSSGAPKFGPSMRGGNQNLARAMVKMRQDRIRVRRAQSFYAIPRIMLKPQVIMPNESVSGIFVCDTSKMKDNIEGNFKITVTIDGEEHKFIFSRS